MGKQNYGFKAGRSHHQALDALYVAITHRKVSYILDADIETYCSTRALKDELNEQEFIKHQSGRQEDIETSRPSKQLSAGVIEVAKWTETVVGTNDKVR